MRLRSRETPSDSTGKLYFWKRDQVDMVVVEMNVGFWQS